MSKMAIVGKNLFIFIVVLVLLLPSVVTGQKLPEKQVAILFTHDLHSYFLPVEVVASDGVNKYQGGFARLSNLIQEQRIKFGDSALLVDVGDFSMGTLFHTLFVSDAAELRLLGAMGYDVGTLGNHEFDMHSDNLAHMLRTAKSSQEKLPTLVTSNFEFKPDNPRSVDLQQAFEEFPINEYVILERNGLRIGLFGLLGKDAGDYSAMPHDVIFTDIVQASKRMVEKLEQDEKVDVIIALSHSGTSDDTSRSEDEILAHEVPEIDVIISGHTHTVLRQPKIIGKTFIGSAGCYGTFLGVLQLDFSHRSGGKLISYDLLDVDDSLVDDPSIAEKVKGFEELVDQSFLSPYELSSEQVVAEFDFNFEPFNSLFLQPRETGIGNLIADSFRYMVEEIEGSHYDPVQLALEPLGMIRSSLVKGNITVSDSFRVLSLGLGPDEEFGSPIASFYLTGDEIRQTLELEATIAPLLLGDAHLQVSGVSFSFDPYRVPFNRVMSVHVIGPDGSESPIDPDKMYRVVTDYWAIEALDTVNENAYGLLKIMPKDKTGRAITDLEETIIDGDRERAGVQEVKEWIALTEYMKSFPDTDADGIPNISENYRQPEGRIEVVSSLSPIALLSAGNYITYITLGVLLLLLALIGLVIWGIVALIRRAGKPR